MFKYLKNKKVITAGRGDTRVVLDQAARLVYQYDDPANILAVKEAKGWLTAKTPYYSTGGWGSGSQGDRQGHYLNRNTKSLLKSCNAKILVGPELVPAFTKQNQDIAAKNKLRLKLGQPVERLLAYENYNNTNSPEINLISHIEALNKLASQFLSGIQDTPIVSTYQIKAGVLYQDYTIVAFYANSKLYMNSQVLSLSVLEEQFLGGESLLQKEISQKSDVKLPFNVLQAANLDLMQTKILEQREPEVFQIKNSRGSLESRHFTGACLLENSGRKFLLDVDRLEIEHRLFNVFFVEVSQSVTTIDEAYQSMMPQSVKDAIASGLEVKRQGEWFFIPTQFDTTGLKHFPQWNHFDSRAEIRDAELRRDGGRPNRLYRVHAPGDERHELVCGVVRHLGREHKDLDLGSKNVDGETVYNLYRVVPNTTVSNFTITGEVD